MKTPQYWIDHLKMNTHPEGGYYKENYRSNEIISSGELMLNFEGTRNLATSIYFMIQTGDVSHFHRLRQDEIWYYHYGSPLTVAVIHPNGTLEMIEVGPDIDKGQTLQATVPGGSIFGSFVNQENTYSLVGCMVNPGFDFADFELFTTGQLLSEFPQHEAIIRKLTKPTYT